MQPRGEGQRKRKAEVVNGIMEIQAPAKRTKFGSGVSRQIPLLGTHSLPTSIAEFVQPTEHRNVSPTPSLASDSLSSASITDSPSATPASETPTTVEIVSGEQCHGSIAMSGSNSLLVAVNTHRQLPDSDLLQKRQQQEPFSIAIPDAATPTGPS